MKFSKSLKKITTISLCLSPLFTTNLISEGLVVSNNKTTNSTVGLLPNAYFASPIFPLINEEDSISPEFDSSNTLTNSRGAKPLTDGGSTTYEMWSAETPNINFVNNFFLALSTHISETSKLNKYLMIKSEKKESLENLINKNYLSKKNYPSISFLDKTTHKKTKMMVSGMYTLFCHNPTLFEPDYFSNVEYNCEIQMSTASIPTKGNNLTYYCNIPSGSIKIEFLFKNNLFNTSDIYLKLVNQTVDNVPPHYEITTNNNEPLIWTGLKFTINSYGEINKNVNLKKQEIFNNNVTDFVFPNISRISISNTFNLIYTIKGSDPRYIIHLANEECFFAADTIHMYGFDGCEIEYQDKQSWLQSSLFSESSAILKLEISNVERVKYSKDPEELTPNPTITIDYTDHEDGRVVNGISIKSTNTQKAIDTNYIIDKFTFTWYFISAKGYSQSVIPCTVDNKVESDIFKLELSTWNGSF